MAYLKLYIITHNALLTIYSNNQSINNQSAQNAWDAQLAPDYFQTKKIPLTSMYNKSIMNIVHIDNRLIQ